GPLVRAQRLRVLAAADPEPLLLEVRVDLGLEHEAVLREAGRGLLHDPLERAVHEHDLLEADADDLVVGRVDAADLAARLDLRDRLEQRDLTPAELDGAGLDELGQRLADTRPVVPGEAAVLALLLPLLLVLVLLALDAGDGAAAGAGREELGRRLAGDHA